jgi:Domain of unknown function (DUF1707)/Cell wall-active antibiotics response 4TMS YvqF
MPDNSRMDLQGLGDNSRLRASDADRDRAATVINTAMAEGRLTADEHSERLDAIYAAKTHADIVPILDDLPAHADAAAPARAASAPAGHPDRIIAIMSGASRKGAWHAQPVIDVVTLMGGAELDFRDAVLPGQEVTIRVVCIMGGLDITVPPEMHVTDSGINIMAGRDVTGDSADSTRPGAPTLRISGFCLMGGVSVRRKERKTGKGSRRREIG